MSIRILKIVLGIVCAAYGGFLAFIAVAFAVAFAVSGDVQLRATSHAGVIGFMAAYLLCGFVLAGIGVFLIVKSRSLLRGRALAIVAAGVFVSTVVSLGMAQYAQAHKKTGAQIIQEDLKQLDAAMEQYATQPDTGK